MWGVWDFIVVFCLVVVFSINLYQSILVCIKRKGLCSTGRVGIRGLTSKNLSKTCLYHVVQLKSELLNFVRYSFSVLQFVNLVQIMNLSSLKID